MIRGPLNFWLLLCGSGASRFFVQRFIHLAELRAVDLRLRPIQSNIIATLTAKPALFLLVLSIVLVFTGRPTDSYAFSFESIEVESKFGERFSAELDVVLDEDGEFEVQIGDQEDYRRLELERPRIIDDLKIVTPVETGGGRRTLRVISARPLFFPSFHLVIRGTYKDGTLLENYLVTVDFQQSLALNVKGPKKQKHEETLSPRKENVDLLRGGEAGADATASADILEETVSDREDAVPFGTTGDEEKPVATSRVDAPTWMAKPPADLKGVRGKDSFFAGATGVFPRVFPENMPPMDSIPSQLEAEERANQVSANESIEPPINMDTAETEAPPTPDLVPQVASGATPGQGYGPLARGETLFTIAEKLNVGGSDPTRIAVALWMDNPDGFLYGNMNGVREGGQLNLENLEKRLEEIDSKRAKEVLRSQWQEWKMIRKKLAALDSEFLEGLTQEIPLPSENEDEKKLIFEMLREWKQTWESKDLDKHLTHFSNQSSDPIEMDFSDLRVQKERMFTRHNRVKLRIQQASLVLDEGQTMVSFGQSFSSSKMESYGRKDIGVAWEDGAWKILKEKFKVNEYLEKHESDDLAQSADEEIFLKERTVSVPFVIHASSHLDYPMATQAVNQLRRLGFNAYSSPVNISRSRKIFRVYVGRFPSLDLAQELASKLKGYAFSRYAIPVKYSYAFMMGEFGSENEAETLILNLRSMEFSPLLFTFSEKEFLNPRFRVFLGAFVTEKDSAKLSDELNTHGLSHDLVTP